MNNIISIDASKARNEFFKILNKVFLEEKKFLIKKSGIPVAEITKPKEINENDILSFAGIWDNKSGKIINKYSQMLRKKGKFIRV